MLAPRLASVTAAAHGAHEGMFAPTTDALIEQAIARSPSETHLSGDASPCADTSRAVRHEDCY